MKLFLATSVTDFLARWIVPTIFKNTVSRFTHAARWPIKTLYHFIYPNHEETSMRRMAVGALLAPLALIASIVVAVAGAVTVLGLAIITAFFFAASLLIDGGIRAYDWVTQKKAPVSAAEENTNYNYYAVGIEKVYEKRDSTYGSAGSYDPKKFAAPSVDKDVVVDAGEIPRNAAGNK